MEGNSAQITQLLLAWRKGEPRALDELMPLVLRELKKIARNFMRGQREGHTLQTTALVNEAFMRLVDSSRVNWQDRSHFFAISAQLMRRVLVDVARRKNSAKRGGDVIWAHARRLKPTSASPYPKNDRRSMRLPR